MRKLIPSLLALTLLAACSTTPTQANPPADATAFLALGIPHASAPPLPDTFCSGQMSQDQFAKLPSVGIHRVISLRRANENGTGWEEGKAKELGIEFVRIEIGGANDLTTANADRLRKALTPAQPTLVACGSSNRVGTMFAIQALQDGKTPEQAMALGKQCGLMQIDPAVKKRLGL
jgi:protein tyrosine phosphatase (PTP) superfamily phosphohydrolase (DUF442 family)